MRILDFRSDTVTRPSQGMRQAIATANVGDDVFGDDPTVNALEKEVAALFRKEAGLFVPTGTMGNQISLKVHTNRGDEMLCDRECHVVNYELAGPVVHAGLLVNLITTEYGMIMADVVRAHVRPRNLHTPLTRIVQLENTHNRHGGTILPQEEILKVRTVCDEFDLAFHLDGARIWHAHVATGVPLHALVAPFDSVSVCFSKGLGAPVGSMILGSADFIMKCRRERKLFGGGMRQSGILAAAARYAVAHNIERLTEDHANARTLAEGLNQLPICSVELGRVQTNIIILRMADGITVDGFLARLKEIGILAVPFGPRSVRMVTHLDVSRSDCEDALARIEKSVRSSALTV